MVYTIIDRNTDRLVLYSKPENVWKIADFGYSTEGTSKTALTSEYARGTASYRAPELVKEKHTFNNKVDIWAMGCILYELAFQKKAFETDMAVLLYALSDHRLKLPSEVDDNIHYSPSKGVDTNYRALGQFVDGMLDSNPSKRPTARELQFLFSTTSAECFPTTAEGGSASKTLLPPKMLSTNLESPSWRRNGLTAGPIIDRLTESNIPRSFFEI
jgi:serine/threonine protein kinase